MSQISFENFARAAASANTGGKLDDTEVAGRYAFQALAERRILADVLSKLALQPEDRLLEIGCGSGNLLIPLSHFVSASVGIDNAPAIERMHARAPLNEQLKGIAGNFLELTLDEAPFNKILVYSVLHYLSGADEVLRFIDRTLALCAPGGRVLLGDLTNRDRKQRFAASSAGKRTSAAWQAQIAGAGGHAFDTLPSDSQLVAIDDALEFSILKHVRSLGHEAYLLPQPPELPFGGSREDILITLHD